MREKLIRKYKFHEKQKRNKNSLKRVLKEFCKKVSPSKPFIFDVKIFNHSFPKLQFYIQQTFQRPSTLFQKICIPQNYENSSRFNSRAKLTTKLQRGSIATIRPTWRGWNLEQLSRLSRQNSPIRVRCTCARCCSRSNFEQRRVNLSGVARRKVEIEGIFGEK